MNKWNNWYKNLDVKNPVAFGDTVTYQKGYNFLKTCGAVEDWGCGAGGFKRFFTSDFPKYIGVDGSVTPFSDIKADLTVYKSKVEGIFMRHIIEHNYEWNKIINNACQSFSTKMCLILFTPFSDKTKEISHNLSHGVDVPDISFAKDDITSIFDTYSIKWDIETINTSTVYGIEHIFYLYK
jgi:hypothetical protein